MNTRLSVVVMAWAGIVLAATAHVGARDQQSAASSQQTPLQASTTAASVPPQRALLNRYCVGCHNQRTKSGNLALDDLDVTNVGAQPQTWEKVVRKVRAGMMPPIGRPRPDEPAQVQFVSWLSGELDRAFDAHPNPGRTETFHRLNRAE